MENKLDLLDKFFFYPDQTNPGYLLCIVIAKYGEGWHQCALAQNIKATFFLPESVLIELGTVTAEQLGKPVYTQAGQEMIDSLVKQANRGGKTDN